MRYDTIAKSYLKVLTEQQLTLDFDKPTESRMISVDGILKHRYNSANQPIHHTDEGIKNFHRWFGNSTTVDEHGRPMVFYHGTYHDFSEFSENQRGLHFVSTSPKWTSKFITGSSGNFDEGQNILPVYVKAHNPFDYQNKKHVNFLATKASLGNLAIQQIRSGSWSRIEDRTTMNHIKNNFDGVYVKEDGVKNLAVFHPHQIKSALGNAGTFGHPTKITESVEHPMIDVDGELKHRNNSLGQPIHPSDEGIRNFHRWANGTELKDSIGRPQLMYHGTSKDVDFSEFKVPKNGVWLTTNKESASSYANQNDSMDMKYDPDTRRYVDVNTAGRVIPLYIKSNSEYKMSEDDHKKINTDNYRRSQGILFDNLRFKNHDLVSHGGGTYTVIGGKHQFKSALGNKGVFSPKKNKIHEAYLNVR